jgi:hypothetical protein
MSELTEAEIAALEAMAEAFSGLQYVVTDSALQWPWTSAPSTNQIVDLVRALPRLVVEIRALRAENERFSGAFKIQMTITEQAMKEWRTAEQEIERLRAVLDDRVPREG